MDMDLWWGSFWLLSWVVLSVCWTYRKARRWRVWATISYLAVLVWGLFALQIYLQGKTVNIMLYLFLCALFGLTATGQIRQRYRRARY